ncbi:pentapeptide repeat-containing protein [Nocardia brasiliensis]|uniref:pentapeptide repeat-containing protein n=1 Tax=Nocardia brasiliensis TaxID=37326 RepID=UPI003D8B2DB3
MREDHMVSVDPNAAVPVHVPEPGWKLLWKTLFGMVATFAFALPVLMVAVRLIDGGGPWWLTGHHLTTAQWYEAVRNTVAVVALTVAGGAAYLAIRRQRTADSTQHTAARAVALIAEANRLATAAQEIAAKAQQTSADALVVSNKQYELAAAQHDAAAIRDLRTRFTTTSGQLAHASPAVRMAGVYAMAALADDWHARGNHAEVQVCVDVLCGYLRLPYTPDPDCERSQNGLEVRKTIVRVIAAHLVPAAEHPWSDRDFDLTGAYLADADFSSSQFRGRNTFNDTVFAGKYASFNGARFFDKTWFEGVTFAGPADFGGARFDEEVSYRNATFAGLTRFSETEFAGSNTWFDGATLDGATSFADAIFGGEGVSFHKTKFQKHTSFIGAAFNGWHTSFDAAVFTGPTISFERPAAWRMLTFDWDHVPGAQPPNVLPNKWPPAVQPTA